MDMCYCYVILECQGGSTSKDESRDHGHPPLGNSLQGERRSHTRMDMTEPIGRGFAPSIQF